MWTLHDTYPAKDGWPGGKRYGYQRIRTMQPRTWTEQEQKAAEVLGLILPDAWWMRLETWWDQAELNILFSEVNYDLIGATYDDTYPFVTVTPRQYVVRAKRYAFKRWERLRVQP